ncbi:MAG TPA: hypothetical protein VGR78_13075 [Verrucomicrobiae bacterium]|jgi:hypothetical protein|nr:hypothetical protein [Verrucomicrobiae bacterium]
MSALRTDYLAKDMEVIFAAPPAAELTGDLSLHLSSGELSEIVSEIKGVSFSAYLQLWIKAYESVGQRGRFLWQWCLKGVRLTTLPSVAPDFRDHVVETKMLGIFFCTLIDDIADREQDREMLEMAISAASENWAVERLELWKGRRRAYLEMISGLWNELWTRCKTYPRFLDFEQLLKFDHDQVMIAMRYALLANQCPGLLNVVEHDLYQPNNMQMIFMATVDLCASPNFNQDELGVIREVFWHAQRMGRIGNMITTWEREVLDRDFTSGIFAFAVHRGILSADDLRNLPAHEIMGVLESAECQEYFIGEWKYHRDQVARKIQKVQSVDLKPYLTAFEEMIKLHLGSRGLM